VTLNFASALKIALKALLRNKSRTFLTMLGIIIGVGSVIAMVSIGRGAQKESQQDIDSRGTNLLMVFASQTSRGSVLGGFGTVNTLTVEDARAIEEQCKHVAYASPGVRSLVQVVYGNSNWNTALMGGNENFDIIRNWKVGQGRFYQQSEVESKAKVAVIGSIVKDELFGNNPALGEVVRINKIPFRVIGILETKGQATFGGNADDVIIIPYTTAMQRIYRRTHIPSIHVSATSMKDSEKAREEITVLLRQRHHIREGDDDDFIIRAQEDWHRTSDESNRVFTILLATIASISLLVGGIGIMNIMLVSVSERVREIGIRIALGAKQKDILLQFIIEAAVLSILGGIIGVLLGIVLSVVISKVAGWATLISIESIVISLVFSGIIGIFFGFYPAWQASKLDPIESLRTE
jgi:putative ABC transport system permease protein